ncbi:hypothetical protein DYI21_04260 [Thalassospira tepidiphila]|jgi:hypothetical protein|uniref:hypothetical protein n=1 Tax=Thalassospira tepidiphila TaxID=393657 RepID=UPI001BCFDE66|nr:hypothetical protein [Thalassospira tepidiphila]MBS8272790.1 hypothetical protein [Thalassospira tepidiphila]
MRSFKFAVVGLLTLLVAACRTAPVDNVTHHAFPAGTEKLSLAQIEESIIKAASDRDWIVTRQAEGELLATYSPRSHMAQVKIGFDHTEFSIVYADSTNLNYDGSSIHYNYNRWVNNLRQDILREVSATAALAN